MTKCPKCNKEIEPGRLLPCIDMKTIRPCPISGWWAFDDPVNCPVFKSDPKIETLKRKTEAAKSLAQYHWSCGNYNRAKWWIGRMNLHINEIKEVCCD